MLTVSVFAHSYRDENTLFDYLENPSTYRLSPESCETSTEADSACVSLTYREVHSGYQDGLRWPQEGPYTHYGGTLLYCVWREADTSPWTPPSRIFASFFAIFLPRSPLHVTGS